MGGTWQAFVSSQQVVDFQAIRIITLVVRHDVYYIDADNAPHLPSLHLVHLTSTIVFPSLLSTDKRSDI